MMQVGLEFGALLDRFLVDFGAKLGGKFVPKSVQEGSQTMFKKKMAPQKSRGLAQGSARLGKTGGSL